MSNFSTERRGHNALLYSVGKSQYTAVKIPFLTIGIPLLRVASLNTATKDMHNKILWPFLEVLTCFGCKNKPRVVDILLILKNRPTFSHINGKLWPRPFKLYG